MINTKLNTHKDEVFLMDSLIISKLCECAEKFSISAKINSLFWYNSCIKIFLIEQSNRTPRCSREVSAAGLPWLEHFRVQCYA